jgi:hypothetical protein
MRRIPLLLVFSLGCERADPVDEPPPELPPLGEMTLAEMPDTDAVPLQTHSDVVSLAWDLSPQSLHSYRLRHDTNSTLTARVRGPRATEHARSRYAMGREALIAKFRSEGKSSDEIARVLETKDAKFAEWLKDPVDKREARTRSDGHLDVRGTGSIGRVECKLSTREYSINAEPQDVNKRPPILFTAEMEGGGRLADLRVLKGEADPVLFDVLLTLPPKPLSVGASDERRVEIVQKGDRPGQSGTIRSTLTGYAKVERYECARLVTELDVEMTPVPPAEGRGRSRGRVVAYFAIAERRIVRVDALIVTSVRTRSRVSHAGGPAVWSVGTLDATTRFTAQLGS